ncbi:MAG TPA: signal recognition particle protein [Acidimicrobiales bacterium]|nr:signal recognition particle protein [Acidimicrobiales bacterium]
MFDTLSGRLEGIIGRLRSRGRLSAEDVDEAMRQIRTALLDADVDVGVARSFVDGIRGRLVGEELSRSLSPAQQVVKAVDAELVRILGGETLRITYAPSPPTVVLLAGLQGSGKTTTSAKLARWFRQQGRNPILVGADLQRPAAVEQLRILGGQAGVPVFSEPTDPVSVAASGLEEARRLGRDVLIVDTAGRLAIDAELMDEVRRVSEVTVPHYTFLVVDAMTGQDAVATAQAFHETLELDGVILTKLDGDARGGAALSVKEVVGRPIAFASTGERLGDFDLFHPDRMANRILGMGDVLTLIEQAEREFDKDVAASGASRLLQGQFTLEDFLAQLQQVKKLGSIGGLLSLLPGVPKELKQANAAIDDGQVSQVEAIIHSMTPKERSQPSVIDGSRRVRIARGSGTTTQEVNQLLRQFSEAQKMIRQPGALSGMLGGAKGGRFTDALSRAMGDAGGQGSLAAGQGSLAAGVGGMGSAGGSDELAGADALAGLGSGGYGSGVDPLRGLGRGGSGRAADSLADAGRKRGGNSKKKKGGRVTPKGGGR